MKNSTRHKKLTRQQYRVRKRLVRRTLIILNGSVVIGTGIGMIRFGEKSFRQKEEPSVVLTGTGIRIPFHSLFPQTNEAEEEWLMSALDTTLNSILNEVDYTAYLLSFDIPISFLQTLQSSPDFDARRLVDYETWYQGTPNITDTIALQRGKYPFVLGQFYHEIQPAWTNSSSEYLTLINKNFQLSSESHPYDLVQPDVAVWKEGAEDQIYLRATAARALERLFQTAKDEAGYDLLARSGYRSYQTQATLYQQYVELNGQDNADLFSARAGHSEHQTGLAMDITSDSVNRNLTQDFGDTPEGIWIKDNAHRFGYTIRYPQYRESDTGYQYEPWHLRYVGQEVATLLYENQWVLEDYLLNEKFLENN